MEIAFTPSFLKAYKRTVKKSAFDEEFRQKFRLFAIDPRHPSLKTHKLSGNLKSCFSFSVGYDIRVLFYFTDSKPKRAVFFDIGKHDDVY